MVEKFPTGRKPGVPMRSRVRSPERRAARLERIAETEIEMTLTALPAISDKPVAEMSSAELFVDNVRKSLCFNREVLDRPVDWGDMELLRLKKEIALGTQAQAIRLKVAELQPRGDDDVVHRLVERVKKLQRGEPLMSIDDVIEGEAERTGDAES